MIIRNTHITDFNKLLEYNQKVFSDRKDSFAQLLSLWFSQNEDEINKSFVIDDGIIKGEVLSSYMSYYYHNTIHESRWGFDLFVDEDLRNENWGIDLMMTYNQAPSLFATGSNDNALKINLKIGYKWLGSIRKYVKLVNPLFVISSFFRKDIPISCYPEFIKDSKGIRYNRVSVDALNNLGCFNDHLLEIRRTYSFLKWRLCSGLHEYAIYKNENSNNYIIARTIIKSHFLALVISDYRCVVDNKSEVASIVSVSERLAKKLHLPVIVFSSSLKAFDSVLEQKHFKSIGRPRPIIGKEKGIGTSKDKPLIDDRNYAFVTLLDSDGETSM